MKNIQSPLNYFHPLRKLGEIVRLLGYSGGIGTLQLIPFAIRSAIKLSDC